MKPIFVVLLALILTVAISAPTAAYMDDLPDGTATLSSSNALAPVVHQVNITGAGFDPAEMTIYMGEDVNFTNQTSGTVILAEGLVYTLYLPMVLRYNPTLAQTPPQTVPMNSKEVAILPGDTYTRNFPLTGTYHFYLHGNLKHQFLLHVIAPPDLEVRTITLNPNPAAHTSTVGLSTDIYNLGLGEAISFPVSWKIFPLGGTTPLESGSWNVSSLPAGGHTTLDATFTASQPGPFTV